MAGTSRRKKNTGARRRKSRSATRVSAKLWLTAGVAISALVFGLFSLLPHVDVKPDEAAASAGKPSTRSHKEKPKEPVFDFYTLLPESEVLTSGERPSPVQAKPKPKPKSAKSKPKPAAPRVVKKDSSATSKPIKQGPPVVSAKGSDESFLLQAGSFRSSQDAERLRVRLILSGYEAKIEKVKVRGGEEWHRVQLGPYFDRNAVDKAKSTLATQGLDTMLLRQQ